MTTIPMARGIRNGLRPLILFLLVAPSCASKPSAPMQAPHWTEVPRTAVEAFCSRRHDEGISPEITINVVRTTQPLVTAAALRGLAEIAFTGGKMDTNKVAAAVEAGNSSIPVAIPAGGCSWRSIDASARANAIDTMTLEISAPFVNPFARSSTGLLGRLSLAGQGTTWYWLPVAQRGTQATFGSPTPLAIRD